MSEASTVSPDASADKIEIAAAIIYQNVYGALWSSLDPQSNYRVMCRGIGRRVVQALDAAKGGV